MSRDVNGNYTLPAGNPVVNGTAILPTWANTTLQDIATALTGSLSRSGAGGMQAAFKAFDGVLANPGISWDAAPTTGIFRDTTHMGIVWAGTELASVDAAGLKGVTAAAGDNSVLVATTAFAQREIGSRAITLRNRLLNGNFALSQRGVGATFVCNSAATVYNVDRWWSFGTAAAGVFSVQHVVGGMAADPEYYIRVKTTTADAAPAAGSVYEIGQHIEGLLVKDLQFGGASAKTITLSFLVRSSLTGTFSGAVRNGSTRAYPFTFAISAANTWESKSVTIPGDVAGTWVVTNALGMSVYLDVGSGSTFEAAAGAWAAGNFVRATGAVRLISTLNATLDFANIQLEKGSFAAAFELRDPYYEELMCRRYYTTSFPRGTTPAEGAGALGGTMSMTAPSTPTSNIGLHAQFPVEMRASPTIATFNPRAGGAAQRMTNNSTDDSGAPSVSNTNTKGFRAVSNSTSLAAGTWYLHYTADAEL